jgi:hypothetical protein
MASSVWRVRTSCRRLSDWQSAGVWERLHRELLRQLNAQSAIDWATSVVDGSHIRAFGGPPHRPFASTVPGVA